MKDRFTQMVEPYHYKVTIFDYPMAAKFAVKLLRRQFAQIRRLVVKEADACTHDGPHSDYPSCEGHQHACYSILAALDAYKRRLK